jgi:hypothetical protein
LLPQYPYHNQYEKHSSNEGGIQWRGTAAHGAAGSYVLEETNHNNIGPFRLVEVTPQRGSSHEFIFCGQAGS